MKYILQKDVILSTICGEQFLIAAGDARGRVPYIEGITKPGAYFWKLLEAGQDRKYHKDCFKRLPYH